MMKRLLILAAFVAAPAFATPAHIVRGYVTQNGTYVAPHYQTNPDSTIRNNYSTAPNVNPYTGQIGTVNPYGRSRSGQRSQPRDDADPLPELPDVPD